MLAMSVLLWIIGGIVLFTDPRNNINRWGSTTAFLYGCGGFSVFLKENIRGFVELHAGDLLLKAFDYFVGTVSAIEHYFACYALLIFSLVYTRILRPKMKKLEVFIKYISLVPPVLMLIFFPISPFYPSYRLLAAWVTVYVMVASLILSYSYLKEKSPRVKRQKLLTCLVVVPPSVFYLITSYILVALEVRDIWRYNIWVVLAQFIIFLGFAIKFGVIGVKLRFEKQSMDNTMKAMTSGTAILNHAIKNEILKISMSIENIKANNPNNKDVQGSIDVIGNSTNYMMEMVKRIQTNVQEIILKDTPCSLINIAELALDKVSLSLKNKNICVARDYSRNMEVVVLCDALHMTEALRNILSNSIEAVRQDGEIRIGICKSKKQVVLYVRDNGTGISNENLHRVIEPFFSTKKNSLNFGLGLSYCYNVMEKHGGSLEVYSKENSGTIVLLSFPKERIIKNVPDLPELEVAYG